MPERHPRRGVDDQRVRSRAPRAGAAARRLEQALATGCWPRHACAAIRTPLAPATHRGLRLASMPHSTDSARPPPPSWPSRRGSTPDTPVNGSSSRPSPACSSPMTTRAPPTIAATPCAASRSAARRGQPLLPRTGDLRPCRNRPGAARTARGLSQRRRRAVRRLRQGASATTSSNSTARCSSTTSAPLVACDTRAARPAADRPTGQVAEMACGAGWASIALACGLPEGPRRWLRPRPRLHRARPETPPRAGVDDRVRFAVADAADSKLAAPMRR